MKRSKKKIGELLLESGLINADHLSEALERQKSSKNKIGKILIELGHVDETALLNKLAEQLQVPFVELKHFDIKSELVQKLPEAIARRNKVILLSKIGNGFLVGMADPTNLIAFDEISRKVKGTLRPALVRESELLRIMDQAYRKTQELASFATELAGEMEVTVAEEEYGEDAASAPVSKMVDTIFEDALRSGASDIHIEPGRDVLRIRLRIDGQLQEQIMQEKNIAAALVLRIKLMAKLNISEKRLPQDGRFSMHVGKKKVDVRVSTMPVQYGESVVMRVLDQSDGVLSLAEIEMPENIKAIIQHQIARPHGMVLVTGPTGSGKTTTLYACLSELNKAESKVITVEDPIEYQLERINQVQIRSKIDLTFAKVLRACLRQDPDIIMVGEIRDEETATIALRAALTGHLVLSTLHTNDAVSAPVRLIDMGIEPFLVATAVRLVVAQRLVRRVCEQCAEEYTLTDKEKSLLKSLMGQEVKKGKFRKGYGCSECNKTGYKGRLGVYEVVEIDQKLADVLRRGKTQDFMEQARSRKEYVSLAQAVFGYASSGITSIDEVIRMAGELEAEGSTSSAVAEK